MLKHLFLLSVIAAVSLAGCAGQAQSGAPVERTLYMAAVEPKGGVTVDKEPFPAAALPAGGGYVIKPPDDTGRWEVSTYRFEPSTLVVNQGDIVTLEIVGINGMEHPFSIEGYGVGGVIRRGEVTRVTFTANEAGIFKITCGVHMPTMQADLIVLSN